MLAQRIVFVVREYLARTTQPTLDGALEYVTKSLDRSLSAEEERVTT
jgi:hypothetical protein